MVVPSFSRRLMVFLSFLTLTTSSSPVLGWEGLSGLVGSTLASVVKAVPPAVEKDFDKDSRLTPPPLSEMSADGYMLKMAYGRTFGTCTALDYATLELSKPVKQYRTMTICGPAVGELHVAVLGSYVLYNGGTVEKIKRLAFQDGFELAGLPKGRLVLPLGPLGTSTFFETGAGMSYVSETYRNSGSRFNWSLLGGVGVEKGLPSYGVVCLGVQWRHLSNGNMWGKGDELHNSNSGTDMLQGLATYLYRF